MDLRFKGFRFRALISLLMALGFLSLAVSGVVLYTAPPCSLAASTGWTFSGISKDSWASLHTGMAVIIIVSALIHLFVLNWKTFVLHLKSAAYRKGKGPFRLSAEVMVGVVLAGVFVSGALGQVGPFGWIHETGDRIKEHYRQEYRTGDRTYSGTYGREMSAEQVYVDEGEWAQKQTSEKSGPVQDQGQSGLEKEQGGRGLGQEQGGRGLGQEQGGRGLGQEQGGRGLGRSRQ